MKSRWIGIIFTLLFFAFLADAIRRIETPLFDPASFQFESKLVYIILSSAGLGALLLFLLVALFPPRSRQLLSPQDPSVLKDRRINQLQSALQLGDELLARELLLHFQKDDPDYAAAMKMKGDVHAADGRWGEAIDAYREALHHSEGKGQAVLFLSLGHVYEQQDQTEQAMDLYQQAFQNAPRSMEVIQRLVDLSVREQDWNEAMRWQEIRERLQERNDSPQESNWRIGIRYELAREAAEKGNRKIAEPLLKYIFRCTSYFTPAYLLQGEIQAKQAGLIAGIKTYEAGYERTQNPVILKRISEAWLLDNQPQRAIDFLRTIVRNHPADTRAAFCLGDLFRKLEMMEEALRVFEGIWRNHPDWLLNNVALAQIYERRGEAGHALELYRGIIDNAETLSVQPWQCYNCNTTYAEYRDLCIVCFEWNSVNLNQNKAGILDFGHEKNTALPL